MKELTEEEQHTLEQGLGSSSAFTVRRCQMLLSNAAGKTAYQIAAELHGSGQGVGEVIHAFEREGVGCL